MSNRKYVLEMDSFSRMTATIAPGVKVGVKVLNIADPKRIHKREHAYVVLDFETPLGTIRVRDLRIIQTVSGRAFSVRWKQWPTGIRREGESPEKLDIAGPANKETRTKFSEAILDVFQQILEESADGTLGHTPELAELKADLEREDFDGPVEDPSNLEEVSGLPAN